MSFGVEAIFSVGQAERCSRPMFVAAVSAGFPSPAEDYLDGCLDLNKHLISQPAATYFVRVAGESMIKAGIFPGDLLIVDRSAEPQDKNVVIASLNGELTVKRIRMQNGGVTLVPENEDYHPRRIDAEMEFEVWGVVTNVVHAL